MGSLQMKTRYINSPSQRKAERDFAAKVLWFVAAVIVVIALASAGFFQLEGVPAADDSQVYSAYQGR